jgi:hypothetical protein
MARTDPPFIVKGFCSCDVTDRVLKQSNTISQAYNDIVDLLRVLLCVVPLALFLRRRMERVQVFDDLHIIKTFFIVLRYIVF